MRAMRLLEHSRIKKNPLQLTEVAEPRPDKGEIRLKIITSGVCYPDLHIAEGVSHPPVTPGHQVVGRVDQLG